MEYSVYDLIRILLRKWYIILLAMCVLGGLSVFTAQRSYDQAVRTYEESISKTVGTGVDTGTLTASYLYDYEVTDLTKYLEDARRRAAFYERFTQALGVDSEEDVASLLDISSLAGTAYSAATQEAAALFSDAHVLANVQTAMDTFHYVEPPILDENENIVVSSDSLSVSKHLTIENLPQNVIRLTVSGLEEGPARQILEAYLDNVKSVGLSDYSLQLSMTEQENAYVLDPLCLSQSAQFAQVVMAGPEKAPVLVKTVGTAVAYAFVFSCFFVLLYTFIKDSHPSRKVEQES